MATWHPDSGITWPQYLQANSFVKDIKEEVSQSGKALESKMSAQTMQIVASNVELSRAFGQGFDSVNNTLHWGFRDVEFAIDQLHADFNYNMGLLVERFQIQNKLFEGLLDKLDEIHKTLESPLLTQARELYRIGCDRVNKKLLDKALDAFLEAEKKNDTDFFIQYHIGMLYLYGIDEDDNVVDLEKAKEHLLQAARYAKAEIGVEPTFSHYAAESLLHASIANYAQLEDLYKRGDQKKIANLLTESKEFVAEAVKLYPQLLEARYHLAKYETLLSEGSQAISDLQNIVEQDRNYALKMQDDQVFDNIRPQIFKMLDELKTKAEKNLHKRLEQAQLSLKKLSIWHPEQSDTLSSQFHECEKKMKLAKTYSKSATYFGYLDAIPVAEEVTELSEELIKKRPQELQDTVKAILKNISFVYQNESAEADKIYSNVETLMNMARSHLSEHSFSSYYHAVFLAEKARDTKKEADELGREAYRQRRNKEERNEKRKELQEYRDRKSSKLAGSYAKMGAFLGSLGGCTGCISGGGGEAFLGGLLIGTVGGAILGYWVGQSETPT